MTEKHLSISPPCLKRRKLSSAKSLSPRSKSPPYASNADHSQESRQHTYETVRIFSWNINGIDAFLQQKVTAYFSPKDTSDISQNQASLRNLLKRHHYPQILCLQEVKISSADTRTQNAVRRAVNVKDGGPSYEVFFTLPTDRFNARYAGGKVYGVCSIIRGDFYRKRVAKVRDVDWDCEGRVSVVEMFENVEDVLGENGVVQQKGMGEKSLAVFNVYAVNGTDKEYRDPKTGAVNGTRHGRKLALHRHLMKECLSMESQGFKVLIIGDLNIAPSPLDGYPNLRTYPEQHTLNRKDFHEKFLTSGDEDVFDGADVWRYLRGDERKYTYFPRGREWGSSCDRVDLVIAGRNMVETGEVVGMEIWDSVKERGPSDHVPLSVDIRIWNDGTESGIGE